jgi:hypothetical protein
MQRIFINRILIEMDTFKPIPGYEGEYEISPMGVIRSLPRICLSKKGWSRAIKGRTLKPILSGVGYYVVALRNSRSIISIHRLVALTFIPNPENKKTVNHKNGIKTDNRVDNLEWATFREQELHSIHVLGKKSKRHFLGKTGADCHNSKPVALIEHGKVVRVRAFVSATDAAKVLGLNNSRISSVCRGDRNHTGGKAFKYI